MSRSSRSRGTTRRRALGRRTRTVPKQLAIGDEREPVRAAGEAAVQAPPDERDRAAAVGLGDAVDDRHGVPGVLEEFGEAGRLVARRARCGRRPRASASIASGSLPARPGGNAGSRQPKGSPDPRLPRPSRRPPAAPTPRSARASSTQPGGPSSRAPADTSMPVLRQFGRLDQLGPPLIGLAPGSRRPRRRRRVRRSRAALRGRYGRARSTAPGTVPRPRRRRRR